MRPKTATKLAKDKYGTEILQKFTESCVKRYGSPKNRKLVKKASDEILWDDESVDENEQH